MYSRLFLLQQVDYDKMQKVKTDGENRLYEMF